MIEVKSLRAPFGSPLAPFGGWFAFGGTPPRTSSQRYRCAERPPPRSQASKKRHWCLCTVNSAGECGDWATASFTTETGTGLTAPTLVSPLDEADGVDQLPLLEWSQVPGTTYDLQLTLATGTFTPPSELALSGLTTTYRWRVRACQGSSVSAWREGSFTMGTMPVPTPPTLLDPEDDELVGLTTGVSLSWSDTGAANYLVELAEADTSFASAQADSVAGVSHQVTGLFLERWYSWRVSSCNVEGVCSAWSAVRWFFTGSGKVERFYYLSDHLGNVRATVNAGRKG